MTTTTPAQIVDAELRLNTEGLRDALDVLHPDVATKILRAMESCATEAAKAALTEAADEWAADPDAVGDTFRDARNWLRERATP